MSQRARVLWVIGLAIIPLLALSGFTIWQQYLRDQFIVAAERTNFAQATAYAAEAFLDGQIAAMRALARHPALARARGGEETEDVLRQAAADNPDWQSVGIAGPDGNAVAGVLSGTRAKLAAKAAVSPAMIDPRSGLPSVVITVPLEAKDAARGAIVVSLPTERFASNLMAKIGSPLVDLNVVDAQGQPFINADAASGLARLDNPAVDAVLAGTSGSVVAPLNGTTALIAYAPVTNYGWGVLLTEPAVSAFATARRQVLERGAVVLVILAVIAALGWTLAGRLALAYQNAVQARAEAERLSQDLKRALHTRDEFLAAASHDLRNPLATIQAAGELVARAGDGAGLARDRLASSAEHILSASRRMAELLDAFLDVSRLEAGKPLELRRRPCDLAPLVRQVVAESQHTTSRHQITIDAPDELPVDADGPRLQRVVGNIVGNAIKYSPDGGEINVKLEAKAGEVLLTVRDRGMGIPGPDQERIFERFQRGTNVEGRIAGTGIGLAGARQIVEQHGGTISVKSQINRGATFTVKFPLGAAAPDPDRTLA
jgi:signal transduction histidine kinase